jgi:hypothetical protein
VPAASGIHRDHRGARADRGIGWRSLHERSTPPPSGGKLVFHVFAALAEFERDDRGRRLGIEVQPELQNGVARQLIEL